MCSFKVILDEAEQECLPVTPVVESVVPAGTPEPEEPPSPPPPVYHNHRPHRLGKGKCEGIPLRFRPVSFA